MDAMIHMVQAIMREKEEVIAFVKSIFVWMPIGYSTEWQYASNVMHKYDRLFVRSFFMKPSEYVTLLITVPETHGAHMREALGRAGAGKIGNYSHCSFSAKGIGRFLPGEGANCHIGQKGVLEEVVEERIEVVCAVAILEHVLEEIKKAHPYEETVIDIYPVYEIGRKKA
jgi:hypothetical protein